MFDQAETLRQRMKRAPSSRHAKVLSVVSGKGGVGKSNVSLNVALALQNLGKRVVLIDLDIGMGNLDILLGLSAKRTIVDMVEYSLPIEEIVEEGPDGLRFVAGGSSLKTLFQLDAKGLEHFLTQLEVLQQTFDFIIFDMGAGISTDAVKFILSSDEILLVLTPEPTAVTDAYSAVKFIHLNDEQLPLSLLVNRCETEREGKETARRFQTAADTFLGKKITLFGILPDDRAVLRAVKAQKPVLKMAPKSRVSRSLHRAVQSYIGEDRKPDGHYQVFVKKLSNYFRDASRK